MTVCVMSNCATEGEDRYYGACAGCYALVLSRGVEAVGWRLEAVLILKLKDAARREKRSLNNYVSVVLEKAVDGGR